MRIAITGSSGLIGRAVEEACTRRGWSVTRIVRRAARPGEPEVSWDPRAGRIDAAGLEAHDVVLHTAGEPIAGLWTPAKKRRIEESRVRGTFLLASTLAGLRSPPRLLISLSATGYYGDRDPAEPMTEDKPPGKGFLPEVCVRWERSADAAREAGIRVVHPRLGNVLAAHGGMLDVLIPIFRLGLGARFGDGRQIWSWIALDDVTGALRHVIAQETLHGPVNFVAPQAVTNAEFTRALAAALHRPSFALPAFLVRLAPGGMGKEMLLAGARVVPAKLAASGYVFRHPRLEPTLRELTRS